MLLVFSFLYCTATVLFYPRQISQMETNKVTLIFTLNFWKDLELDESRKVQQRVENAKQKINKFRKNRNTAEKCGNLAENYLLEFQKAWNVFLKGAGAVWRQKSMEKRRNMQKGLAVGRYCCERYFWKELELKGIFERPLALAPIIIIMHNGNMCALPLALAPITTQFLKKFCPPTDRCCAERPDSCQSSIRYFKSSLKYEILAWWNLTALGIMTFIFQTGFEIFNAWLVTSRSLSTASSNCQSFLHVSSLFCTFLTS